MVCAAAAVQPLKRRLVAPAGSRLVETTWCLSTNGAVSIDIRTMRDGEPDLALAAAGLAAAYLGTTSFSSLAGAGRVVERSPGAVARADTLFAWAPAPWCPNVF